MDICAQEDAFWHRFRQIYPEHSACGPETERLALTQGGRPAGTPALTAKVEAPDLATMRELGFLTKNWALLNYSDALKRHPHVRLKALLPNGQQHNHQLARLIVSSMLLACEAETGLRAPECGWIAKFRDGNPLNLTRPNLAIRSATDAQSRNSDIDITAMRERQRIAATGADPNAVFLARRPKKRKGKRDRNGPKGGAK